jgi:hypothetical protein
MIARAAVAALVGIFVFGPVNDCAADNAGWQSGLRTKDAVETNSPDNIAAIGVFYGSSHFNGPAPSAKTSMHEPEVIVSDVGGLAECNQLIRTRFDLSARCQRISEIGGRHAVTVLGSDFHDRIKALDMRWSNPCIYEREDYHDRLSIRQLVHFYESNFQDRSMCGNKLVAGKANRGLVAFGEAFSFSPKGDIKYREEHGEYRDGVIDKLHPEWPGPRAQGLECANILFWFGALLLGCGIPCFLKINRTAKWWLRGAAWIVIVFGVLAISVAVEGYRYLL